MTARTRRRLIFCLVVISLTLPVESVLLQAVSTSDAKTAAIDWAASLSPDALSATADQIEQFPFIYRRAIMRAVTPQRRSLIWRAQISRYVNEHSDLSAEALGLLQAARDLATPENLSNPSADARAQMKSIGDQLAAAIGREDAEHVLYRLGPRDGTFQSLEPTRLKLANWVRDKFVALAAAMVVECDCIPDWGCGGPIVYCRSNSGCLIDDTWPACGWWWNENCDGQCSTLIMGETDLGRR